MIKAMIRHAEQIEPEPKYKIMGYGHLMDSVVDPLFGGGLIGMLHRILTHERVQNNHTVTRSNNVITIRINIEKLPWFVATYIQSLYKYGSELSRKCKIVIECYPFIRAICHGTMEQ